MQHYFSLSDIRDRLYPPDFRVGGKVFDPEFDDLIHHVESTPDTLASMFDEICAAHPTPHLQNAQLAFFCDDLYQLADEFISKPPFPSSILDAATIETGSLILSTCALGILTELARTDMYQDRALDLLIDIEALFDQVAAELEAEFQFAITVDEVTSRAGEPSQDVLQARANWLNFQISLAAQICTCAAQIPNGGPRASEFHGRAISRIMLVAENDAVAARTLILSSVHLFTDLET